MSRCVAGIDIHKKVLMVVVATVSDTAGSKPVFDGREDSDAAGQNRCTANS